MINQIKPFAIWSNEVIFHNNDFSSYLIKNNRQIAGLVVNYGISNTIVLEVP